VTSNTSASFENAYSLPDYAENPTAPRKIRIAVVDDYPIIREGLRNLTHAQPDIEVIAEGQSGQDALDIADNANPDVMVLDINLPDENGIEITHKLKTRRVDFPVVLLTAYDDYEQAIHAIRAGAAGYCAKDIPPQALLEGIRQVARGKYMIREKILTRHEIDLWVDGALEKMRGYETIEFAEHFMPLSAREMDVLDGVVRGMSNKEIARYLSISHQTVKNHMTSILDKMNVADRTQAAMYAIQRGWIRIATNETQPHRVPIVR